MYRSILATLFFAVNVAAQGKPDDPTNYTPKRVRDLREEDDKHLAELRAPGSGWVEIEDGILMKIIEKSSDPDGDLAGLEKDIKCHFTGMFCNGTVFDASHQRGDMMQVPVSHTLPGWQICLSLMRKGDKAHCYLEPQWAFGEHGARPHVPSNTVVNYIIELEDVFEGHQHQYIHPDHAEFAEEYQKFLNDYAAKKANAKSEAEL